MKRKPKLQDVSIQELKKQKLKGREWQNLTKGKGSHLQQSTYVLIQDQANVIQVFGYEEK